MKTKDRISRMRLLIYLVLLPYLKPYNVTLIPFLDLCYKSWKLVITAALLVLFLRKGKRLSTFSLLAGAFCAVWSVSIFRNLGYLGEGFQAVLSIIGMCLLFDYYAEKKSFKENILYCVSNITKVYIVLNTVTVLFQKPLFAEPEITYICHFLGSDNYWAFILLPLCGIMFAYDFYKYNKCRRSTWAFALCGWANLLLQFSVAGLVAYSFFLFMVGMIYYPAIRKMFSIKNILLLVVFMIILIGILNPTEILGSLLSKIGKSGFSSREYIWPMAMQAIKENWLIGYGELSQRQIDSYILYGANHTHNIILEYLFDVGVIGFSIVSVWFGHTLKLNKNNKKLKYLQVLLICFTANLLCGIFDFYISLIYFYLLLCVIYVCKK